MFDTETCSLSRSSRYHTNWFWLMVSTYPRSFGFLASVRIDGGSSHMSIANNKCNGEVGEDSRNNPQSFIIEVYTALPVPGPGPPPLPRVLRSVWGNVYLASINSYCHGTWWMECLCTAVCLSVPKVTFALFHGRTG